MADGIAINTFQNGMISDFNEIILPDATYTDALNATLITYNGNENSLLCDLGNARVYLAYLPEGYIPLGSCSLGGIIYINSYNPFTGYSQIGSFPSPLRYKFSGIPNKSSDVLIINKLYSNLSDSGVAGNPITDINTNLLAIHDDYYYKACVVNKSAIVPLLDKGSPITVSINDLFKFQSANINTKLNYDSSKVSLEYCSILPIYINGENYTIIDPIVQYTYDNKKCPFFSTNNAQISTTNKVDALKNSIETGGYNINTQYQNSTLGLLCTLNIHDLLSIKTRISLSDNDTKLNIYVDLHNEEQTSNINNIAIYISSCQGSCSTVHINNKSVISMSDSSLALTENLEQPIYENCWCFTCTNLDKFDRNNIYHITIIPVDEIFGPLYYKRIEFTEKLSSLLIPSVKLVEYRYDSLNIYFLCNVFNTSKKIYTKIGIVSLDNFHITKNSDGISDSSTYTSFATISDLASGNTVTIQAKDSPLKLNVLKFEFFEGSDQGKKLATLYRLYILSDIYKDYLYDDNVYDFKDLYLNDSNSEFSPLDIESIDNSINITGLFSNSDNIVAVKSDGDSLQTTFTPSSVSLPTLSVNILYGGFTIESTVSVSTTASPLVYTINYELTEYPKYVPLSKGGNIYVGLYIDNLTSSNFMMDTGEFPDKEKWDTLIVLADKIKAVESVTKSTNIFTAFKLLIYQLLYREGVDYINVYIGLERTGGRHDDHSKGTLGSFTSPNSNNRVTFFTSETSDPKSDITSLSVMDCNDTANQYNYINNPVAQFISFTAIRSDNGGFNCFLTPWLNHRNKDNIYKVNPRDSLYNIQFSVGGSNYYPNYICGTDQSNYTVLQKLAPDLLDPPILYSIYKRNGTALGSNYYAILDDLYVNYTILIIQLIDRAVLWKDIYDTLSTNFNDTDSITITEKDDDYNNITDLVFNNILFKLKVNTTITIPKNIPLQLFINGASGELMATFIVPTIERPNKSINAAIPSESDLLYVKLSAQNTIPSIDAVYDNYEDYMDHCEYAMYGNGTRYPVPFNRDINLQFLLLNDTIVTTCSSPYSCTIAWEKVYTKLVLSPKKAYHFNLDCTEEGILYVTLTDFSSLYKIGYI